MTGLSLIARLVRTGAQIHPHWHASLRRKLQVALPVQARLDRADVPEVRYVRTLEA